MTQPSRTLTLFAALAIATIAGCGDASPDADEMGTSTDTVTAVAPTDDAALIDPNSASRQELMSAGVDSAAVAIITSGRPFADMLTLDQALSATMDSAALDGLYRRVWIPLDLNTASEEEILLIPGVGSRMAHEFEEYRPYEAMAQFRREIGKYVDDEEVARLERYVTIR